MWRWNGVELERGKDFVFLEAICDMDAHYVGGLHLLKGDRMLERYYADRWYNIFEVFDGRSGNFTGWYCNLSEPAEIGEKEILFRDLALDLIVYPDGRQEELDEDEFEALDISEELRDKALAGWDELRQLFHDLYKK
jgi:protein associated with RNAse G/E